MQPLIIEIITMSAVILPTSYGLHYLAYRRGWDDENDQITKAKSDERKAPIQHSLAYLLIRKWLDFGGGYYGIIALTTLIFIEIRQVQGFLANWQGSKQLIDSFGINFIISFFVEQIQNFVAAIIWPKYYLSRFSLFKCAVFIASTYLLYDWTKKLAKKTAVKSTLDK